MTDNDKLKNALDQVHAVLTKYVYFTKPEHYDAAALFVLHSHMAREWDVFPRLILTAATPGSGKSTAGKVVAAMCPVDLAHRETLQHIGPTVAGLMRVTNGGWKDNEPTTILVDELEQTFRQYYKGSEAAAGVVNFIKAGFDRGAVEMRAVGLDDTKLYRTAAPMILVSIKEMPEEIESRGVVIRMRKKLPGYTVAKFRRRAQMDVQNRVGAAVASAAAGIDAEDLPQADLPPGLDARAEDIWEPLLQLSALAGEDWAKRGYAACEVITTEWHESNLDDAYGPALLRDVSRAFAYYGATRLTTETLLDYFKANSDERHWGSALYGASNLRSDLKAFEIRPEQVRENGDTEKRNQRGYKREHFIDAWQRHGIVPEADEAAKAEERLAEEERARRRAAAAARKDRRDAAEKAAAAEEKAAERATWPSVADALGLDYV